MSDINLNTDEILNSINKLTDIYILKKPELINLCKIKKLKTDGKVNDLRPRLVRYFRGILKLTDIEDCLNQEEKNQVLNDSIKNKIDTDNLEKQLGLDESNSDLDNSIQINSYTNVLDESQKACDSLYTNIDNIEGKINSILDTSNNLYNNVLETTEDDRYSNITGTSKLIDSHNNTRENIYEQISENLNPSNNLNITINKQIKQDLGHIYDDVASLDYTRVENIEKKINIGLPNNKVLLDNKNKVGQLLENKSKNSNIIANMTEKRRSLHITPDYFTGNEDVKKFLKQYSIITEFNNWDEKDKIRFLPMFVKGTASSFLENLNSVKENWTWSEIESAFIEQYLPIGHITYLKTTLENRRQSESESATSFMTEIESLCRQIDCKMKEEDICLYILKGLKEHILHTISMQDNTTLKKLKENLKKYELMQYRINTRGPVTSEYTDMLNLQVAKLQNYHKEKELEEIKNKYEEETLDLKRKLDQLSEEVKRMNFLGKHSQKTVDFNENRYDDNYNVKYYRDTEIRGRNYDRNRDYGNKQEYRYKSPYPGRSRDLSRESRKYNNRDRSFSRDNQRRNRNGNFSRENSYTRNDYYNRELDRESYLRPDSRDRDRRNRSRTPERYRNEDREGGMRGQIETVICYKCDRKGHYANQCQNTKN